MLLLTTTGSLLQLVTGSSVTTIFAHGSYIDFTSSTATPGRQNTKITGTATTTVVGSPAASTIRAVESLFVQNGHASSTDLVTIQHTDGSTTVDIFGPYTLGPGETVQYTEGSGFLVMDNLGNVK